MITLFIINIYNIIQKDIKNVIYKIHTINNDKIFYKIEITFNFKNKDHKCNIYYDKRYPFVPPVKLEIDNINIFDEYNIIMRDNNDLFGTQCICCKSIICCNNWTINFNINTILDEIIKVINYKELKIKRNLLNVIISKYTNQNLDYLHYYLI
jgi:hypothetical protein